ncbi:MAG: hypothetical protein ACI8RA_002762 [Chlamydiales bacterium]|jgi:hypothetical protein
MASFSPLSPGGAGGSNDLSFSVGRDKSIFRELYTRSRAKLLSAYRSGNESKIQNEFLKTYTTCKHVFKTIYRNNLAFKIDQEGYLNELRSSDLPGRVASEESYEDVKGGVCLGVVLKWLTRNLKGKESFLDSKKESGGAETRDVGGSSGIDPRTLKKYRDSFVPLQRSYEALNAEKMPLEEQLVRLGMNPGARRNIGSEIFQRVNSQRFTDELSPRITRFSEMVKSQDKYLEERKLLMEGGGEVSDVERIQGRQNLEEKVTELRTHLSGLKKEIDARVFYQRSHSLLGARGDYAEETRLFADKIMDSCFANFDEDQRFLMLVSSRGNGHALGYSTQIINNEAVFRFLDPNTGEYAFSFDYTDTEKCERGKEEIAQFLMHWRDFGTAMGYGLHERISIVPLNSEGEDSSALRTTGVALEILE